MPPDFGIDLIGHENKTPLLANQLMSQYAECIESFFGTHASVNGLGHFFFPSDFIQDIAHCGCEKLRLAQCK
jgi:hypothetical protein